MKSLTGQERLFLTEYRYQGIKVAEKYGFSQKKARNIVSKYYLPLLGNCDWIKGVMPEQKPCMIVDPIDMKKARKREYNQRPEAKAKRREYMKEYFQRPEVKAKRREYERLRYLRKKEKK